MPKQLIKIILLICLSVQLLAACGGAAKQVENTTDLLLLPPSAGPQSEVLKQKVTLTRGGKNQTFIVLSQFAASLADVAVLTATGQTLLTMRYDGEQFDVVNISGVSLPAKEMMAIMQFALWPETALQEHYNAQAGWYLQVQPKQRVLDKQQDRILMLSQQGQRTVIEYFPQHYQLIIEPLADELL